MGTFCPTFEVGVRLEGPFETVEGLVDSGPTYTLVPARMLRRLGVRPRESRGFILADGTRVNRDVGEVQVRLGGRTPTSLVVFGDDEAAPLLGAVTLEAFSLGIDPVNGELTEVPGYLVGIREEGDS